MPLGKKGMDFIYSIYGRMCNLPHRTLGQLVLLMLLLYVAVAQCSIKCLQYIYSAYKTYSPTLEVLFYCFTTLNHPKEFHALLLDA